MLASTVQFSNNDQPPITPLKTASALGPATEGQTHTSPYLQIPNSVPDPTDMFHTFHAEAVLAKNNLSCRVVNVPPMSNQHRTFAGVLASDQPELVRSAP
jgi:hypothetical protein